MVQDAPVELLQAPDPTAREWPRKIAWPKVTLPAPKGLLTGGNQRKRPVLWGEVKAAYERDHRHYLTKSHTDSHD